MSIPHLPCVSEERSIYPLDSATAHREVWRCLSMLSSGGRNVAAAHLRLELALIALLSVTLRLKALALCPSRGALRLTRTTCPIGNVHGWHGRKLLSSARSNGDFEYTRGPRGSNGVFYPDKSSLRLGDNSGHAYVEGETFSVPGGDPETTGSSEITQEGFPRRTVGLSQNFRRPAAVGPLQESARSEFMPPGLVWRAGVKGVVPLAAAIGISLTPSRYLLARVASGVVLATAANVGRQAAMATKKRQAPKALLGLLRREGVDEVTREQLVDLADKFFVKESELWRLSRLLYSAILTDTVTDQSANAEGLDRLFALKWTLGLHHDDLVACHQEVVATALSLVGRPVSMDKVIYLSERMFYQEGTMNAGYLDQCAKLRSELGGMTQVELLRKVTQFAAPFYESVLEDVVSRPESFSGEILLRTRRRLGVSEVVAGGMHLDVYQSTIQSLLDTQGRLDERDRNWLGRLRGIMGVSQFEGERALESVTAPVYREAVQAAFAEAKGMAWGQPGVDSLRSKLKARQGDLQLSMAAADSVMKETIRKLAFQSLEGALAALRSGRGASADEEVLRSISEVFRLRKSAALLAQNYLDADCSRYFSGVLVGSPSLRLTDSEKRSIYRVHLDDGVKDMRLDEEDKAALEDLRGMLQLPEADCRQVHLDVVSPLLAQRLTAMVEKADFSREDVSKLEGALRVSRQAFLDLCMEAYHARLTRLLAGAGGDGEQWSIFSDAEKAVLDSVAEALGLSKGQLSTIHDVTCGPAFKAAALGRLKDAGLDERTATTQEAEPAVLALESLRTRLGMSIDGARGAFVRAFYDVVAPKVKQVAEDIEALGEARKMMPPSASAATVAPVASASPPVVASRARAPSIATSTYPAVAKSPATAGESLNTSGGDVVKTGRRKAGSESSDGAEEGGESHSERLKTRAAEIVERLVELATFCETVGASRELEVALSTASPGRTEPLHPAELGQALAPRAAQGVYTFFLEEAFSPSRGSIDADTEGALVRRRGPLALVLGLSRARAIEAQRRTASRLYLTFLQGTLEKKWALDHVDLASLKTIEEELGMTRVVCDELLARGRKSFVRRKVEEAGSRVIKDPVCARALRECANGLGVSLRDDLALPEERRRGMLEAEARAVLSEGVDAASAKSILEVACLSLGLPKETVHQTFTALRDAPESEADGTVAMVRNGSTTEDHGAEEDAGGSQGVTNPAATFAASE